MRITSVWVKETGNATWEFYEFGVLLHTGGEKRARGLQESSAQLENSLYSTKPQGGDRLAQTLSTMLVSDRTKPEP